MPTLYLIAGCNGCGKTTFMRSPEYLQAVDKFDPDAQYAALGDWREMTKRLREHLSAKRDLDIARVATRTALGGHHITDTDIKRRWHTSLANLPFVMGMANSTLILDNSLPQEHARGAFRTVARLQNSQLELGADLPEWARTALPSLFKESQQGHQLRIACQPHGADARSRCLPVPDALHENVLHRARPTVSSQMRKWKRAVSKFPVVPEMRRHGSVFSPMLSPVPSRAQMP